MNINKASVIEIEWVGSDQRHGWKNMRICISICLCIRICICIYAWIKQQQQLTQASRCKLRGYICLWMKALSASAASAAPVIAAHPPARCGICNNSGSATYTPTYTPTHLPTNLHTDLYTHLPTNLHTDLPKHFRNHFPLFCQNNIHFPNHVSVQEIAIQIPTTTIVLHFRTCTTYDYNLLRNIHDT
jgi:hypothetical protein